MINKRWITLPVIYRRPFASKAVFWAILKKYEFAVDCFLKYNFLGGLAPDLLDGFSIGRYEEKREVFDLFAAKFERGAMRFLGEKSLRRWSPFKTGTPPLSFYYKEQSTANSNSFKIAQKTAFEEKGRLYTTGKVIQRLFIIDL